MAATIQNIEFPTKPRALDTSTSVQEISQELFVTADAASIANEANGVGAWTGLSGITPVVVSTGQYAGTYAAKYTASGDRDGMYMDLDTYCTVGKTYRINVWGKHGNDGSTDNIHYIRLSSATILSGGEGQIDLTNPTTGRAKFQEGETADVAWSERSVIFTHSANTRYFGARESGGHNDGSILIDALSIKEVKNFSNNNHGDIYSGRALEFDGVTDYLEGVADINTSYGITNDITVACWIKLNATAGIQNAWNIYENTAEAFGLRYDTSNSALEVFNDINDEGSELYSTEVNANTWYRVVVVVDSLEVKLYINGILSGSGTSVADGFDSFNSKIFIGQRGNAQWYFNGLISDVQFWDKVWSTDDIAYDFANPESLALNTSGTALTESNLKVWYPMQDGHRGQQSYILDGSNTGLVRNIWDGAQGDITNWTAMGTNAIATDNGAVKVTYSNVNTGAKIELRDSKDLSEDLTVGTTYKITLKAKAEGGDNVDVVIHGPGTYIATDIPDDSTTFSSYEGYFVASHATDNYIRFNNVGTGDVVWIKDIAIYPINDKHHATTAFFGDELITDAKNRTFASGPDWQDSGTTANQFAQDSGTYDEAATSGATEGTALTAYDGTTVTFADNYLKLAATSDASDLRLAELDGAAWETGMVVGRTYRLSYAIEITAMGFPGGFSIGFGDTDVDTDADKLYTTTKSVAADYFDFVYKGTTTHAKLFLQAAVSSAFTVYLDNFSLKEVGTASGWTDADQQLDIAQPALQSYNEMAWFDGVADHVTVSDHDAFSFGDGGTTDSAFSISAWAFANEATDFIIISKANEWSLKFNSSDKPRFTIYDNGQTNNEGKVANTAVSEGKWYHIVGTYDGTGGTSANGGMELYVNGVSDGVNTDNGTYAAMHNTANVIRIGRDQGAVGDPHANGCVTEISIWNKELSSAEVLELYNDGKALDATTHSATANIVAYWRNNGLSSWPNLKNPGTYNTDSGTSLTETLLIPQGVDGSRDTQGFIMNKPRNTSSLNMTKKFGASSVGVDGYVDLGSTRTVADGGAFSLCVWLKPDDLDSNNYFIGGGSEDWIKIQSSTTIMVGATSITDTFTIDAIAAKEWVHVAIVKKADDVGNIYINGDVSSSTIDFDDKAFDYRYLGARQTNAYTFRGQVDGVLIYDDELTGPEVLRNYKATKGSHR